MVQNDTQRQVYWSIHYPLVKSEGVTTGLIYGGFGGGCNSVGNRQLYTLAWTFTPAQLQSQCNLVEYVTHLHVV